MTQNKPDVSLVCMWLQAGGGAASVSEVSGQTGAAGAGTTAGRQTDGDDAPIKIQGIYNAYSKRPITQTVYSNTYVYEPLSTYIKCCCVCVCIRCICIYSKVHALYIHSTQKRCYTPNSTSTVSPFQPVIVLSSRMLMECC